MKYGKNSRIIGRSARLWVGLIALLGSAVAAALPIATPLGSSFNLNYNEEFSLNIDLNSLFDDADPTHDLNLTFTDVSVPGGSVVSVSIDGAGVAHFTGNPDAFGAQTVTVQADDGAGNTAQIDFIFNISNINDPPIGVDDTYSVDEDGALSVPAPGVLANDTDVDGPSQTASLLSDVSNGTLTLNGDGSFNYTPDPDFNGSDSFTYQISDGSLTDTAIATITVNAVNDTPTFTPGGNVLVLEDSGAYGAAWASGMSAGPADESGQTLTFNVGNDNNALFSVQPSLDGAGNLSFTPAADANGIANVTATLTDNGGGADTSAPVNFTITVTGVNDAPSYTGGGDVTVDEDSGAQTLSAWATAISSGPADESGQNLTFFVAALNPALFSVQPAIDATTGDLTFTPAANASGNSTVNVELTDNGGVANGGQTSSGVSSFTLTVNPVNDAPSFSSGGDVMVLEDSGAYGASWATALSAGPADEAAQTLSFAVTNNNNGLFAVQPAVDATGNLTFTPAADVSGTALVDVVLQDNGGTANGGVDASAVVQFNIDVTSVNDAPSFTAGADESVLEDSGAHSVAGWATALSAGPADESTQTLSFNVSNDNNGLFAVQPNVDPLTGTLSYTLNADAVGSASVSVSLSDDGGTLNGGVDTSAVQVFTIDVTGVNDVPMFSAGADQTVLEDSGAQTVPGWATGISPGPADENTQLLTFTLTPADGALFSVAPAVDAASGDLTYTPAPGAFGATTVDVVLADNGGTANGGVDTSAAQTFTINIDSVNDAPSFTPGPDQAVDEDAGPQVVAGWATAISAGPANESAQVLTFSVSAATPGLFSVQPQIDASTGDLTYTPAANAVGSTSVSVELTDDGGVLNGGSNSSGTISFNISIGGVNDAPSFVAGSDQTVLEDSGAQTVVGWASAISAGPADEAAQLLTFTLTPLDGTLFSVAPAVDAATGDLTYTPAPDAYGTTAIDVVLSDNGGTAAGGVDTSAVQTFTITVNPVNDAPSFVAGADQNVPEDSGMQMVPGWATAISAGPANESAQTVGFTVTNDNNALFAAQPAVDAATGDLSFSPAPNAVGSALVSVSIFDNGGTANGGTDGSAVQTFTITVDPVNDAPSFATGPDLTVLEDSGPQSFAGWASGITAGPADETAQSLAFAASNDNNALFSVQPSVDAATGTVSFTSAPDAYGSATVTLTLTDNGGTAGGGSDTSAPQTFTITVDPVNDAPDFVAGPDQTVLEDSGLTLVPGWASALDKGQANESAQTLTFVVTSDNPSLFGTAPAVDGVSGDLSFAPAANAVGSAIVSVTLTDDGGTANGGSSASAVQTFTITVDPVNDAPSFSVGPNIVAAEDAGPMTYVGWATGMSAGPADEAAQVLTFNIVGNDNPSLFSTPPALDASTGTLTFQSAPDANGVATITVNLSDDGGTLNGGVDTSANQTFVITVNGVNDLPVAADDSGTMAEDGPPLVINVLANDYLAEGPTVVTSAGAGGYSEGPPTTVLNQVGDPISTPNGQVTIVGGGTQIQYEPKADFYGSDFFTYTITDSNGDTSVGTVNITVTPVNDPPIGVQERTFTIVENSELIVDAGSGALVGAYDVDGALLDAFGNPVGSAITAQIDLFPVVGLLSFDGSTGEFTYTPPVNYTGVVEFSYRLSDGTALSVGDAYRMRVVVLAAPPPPAPPPAGEVAVTFNLSQVPLEQSSSVPPNVLVVMDDSGSMDWNMIVSGTDENGGFVIDNSDIATRSRRSTSYVYMFDLPNNAFSSGSSNGRILPTPEALEADADTDGNEYGVWRGWNSQHNRLYYNPQVEYTPWIGQDAVNADFDNAVPTAIRLDPVDPTSTFDITVPYSYTATSVPNWRTNGGNGNVSVNNAYIPRYYATTATAPLAWDDPHTLVEIRAGSGPLPGDMFPGGPGRDDCAVGDDDPLTCTFDQELQNFANWFQYYRSREYVAKNGLGKVVSQLQDIRVGYETINRSTSEEVRDMNDLYVEGNKKLLLDDIYSVNSLGGTPLRRALERAGDIFACEAGGYCPALPAPEGFCQQNFALLFSDGYWNGGDPGVGNEDSDGPGPFDGGRYADTRSRTLADVAMHYYETDLQPTYDDLVPVTRRDDQAVPSGTFPASGAVMHQNMKTYTISFGAMGTVDPSSVPSNPVTPFAWPNPTSGSPEKIDDMLHAAVNGRGRFLNATDPQDLQRAMETAFQEFTQEASSVSAAAFNSTSLREGTLLYRGFYDLRDSSGELTATEVFPDGTIASAPTWRASEMLDAANKLPGNRVLVTFDPLTRTGLPFRYPSLAPQQQASMVPEQVNFIRGVRTDELPAGSLRERATTGGILGDIVNSSPVFVGEPRSINRDQAPYPTSDLYSDFAAAKASRTPIVYVGANDGMMHGFDALTGEELFGYVPNMILDGSAYYRNPLSEFTDPFYQHNYYVDLTPRLNDAYMRPRVGAASKSWNSVLVGGLGAGGKGFFALNVTDPDSDFSTEANAAGVPLWEFTEADDTYPVDSSGNPLGGAVGAITDPYGRPVKDLGYAMTLPTVAMSNAEDATGEKGVDRAVRQRAQLDCGHCQAVRAVHGSWSRRLGRCG
ncbi:MAG: PilC/PilY family type IV pilus protein [Pseudomonadales bacterium]